MTHCALLFLFTCYRLVHVKEEVAGRAGRGVMVSRSGGGGGVCMFSARERMCGCGLWVLCRGCRWLLGDGCWMLVDGRRKRYQIQKKKSKYNLYHVLHTAYSLIHLLTT